MHKAKCIPSAPPAALYQLMSHQRYPVLDLCWFWGISSLLASSSSQRRAATGKPSDDSEILKRRLLWVASPPDSTALPGCSAVKTICWVLARLIGCSHWYHSRHWDGDTVTFWLQSCQGSAECSAVRTPNGFFFLNKPILVSIFSHQARCMKAGPGCGNLCNHKQTWSNGIY